MLYVDVVYTDFAKAFVKVSHNALLEKLQKSGFHSSILNWFKSYLDDRIYRVECSGVFSSLYVATSEVHWVRFFSSSSLMIKLLHKKL